MDRKEVYDRMVNIVEGYIEDFDSFGPDLQIRINPVSGMIEVDNAAERDTQIDESDATLEATADAESLASRTVWITGRRRTRGCLLCDRLYARMLRAASWPTRRRSGR